MASEWDADSLKKREGQRNRLREIIFSANEKGDKDKVKSAIKLLRGNELSYTFDELPYNKDYVSSLYRGHRRSVGEDAEISVKKTKELIETDFEFFNLVRDGSLVAGGLNLIDVLGNYDDSQKADMLRRLETYDRVDSFGRGSRPFIEQLKGISYGIGVDIVSTGGIASLYKLLTKPITHKLEGEAVKKLLSPTKQLVAGSAAYGATGDVTQQATEMQLRDEQEYSPVRTGVVTALSGVTPLAGKPLGTAIGKVQRMALHPAQSIGTVMKSQDWVGGLAATKQLQEAFDALQLRGVDMSSGSAQMAFKIKNTFKNIDNAIDGQYKNLDLKVNKNDIETLLRNAKNKGTEIPQSVLDIVAEMQATRRTMSGYGSGKGSYIEATLKPDDALRSIKNHLWQEAQDKMKTGKSAVASKYNSLRREMIVLEDSAATKVGGKTLFKYKGLKRDFELFHALKETDMGKKITNIVSKKGKDSKKAVEELMDEMTKGDFAWGKFDTFTEALNAYGTIEGRAGASLGLKNELQQSFGYFLTHNKGSRLVEMLGSPDGRGMSLLKSIYPEDIKLWSNLSALAEKMAKAQGKAKKMGNSVIANMVVARLGSKIGKDVAGDVGAGAGAITGIMGISQLLNSKFFQSAMVHTLNNDGRMSTGTRNWLKKKGYSIGQINSITDTLTGLPFAGYASGNIEEIWEKNKDPIDARIEEIRQNYLF